MSSGKGAGGIPAGIWAIAAAAILIRALVLFSTHFTYEDFFITLRYAENLAHGLGLVYNPDQHVLGTTTPLYTLYLALAAWLGVPALAAGKAANIMADGLLCLVMYRWLRSAGYEKAGWVAAVWVAVNPLHIRLSISGMETGLVTLCGTYVWLAFAERRYRAAYLALGVLFLLRWDSALMAGVLTAAVVLRERRVPWRELLLYAAVVAPWVAFATWYFGSPIPVTGTAKMTVYGWMAATGRPSPIPKLLFRVYGTVPYALVAAFALAGLWRVWRDRERTAWPLWPSLAWFAAYWAAFAVSKVLLFEWYLLPPLPVYGALFAVGLAAAGEAVARRWPRALRTALAWGAAALVGGVLVGHTTSACRETQLIEDNLRQPIGLWLKANAGPSDRVFLEPIGYIGYYSELPVIDAIGLVSPEVLRFWAPGHTSPWLDIVDACRPEWCVLRPNEAGNVRAASAARGEPWDGRYALARTFSYSPRAGRDQVVFYVFRRRVEDRRWTMDGRR